MLDNVKIILLVSEDKFKRKSLFLIIKKLINLIKYIKEF